MSIRVWSLRVQVNKIPTVCLLWKFFNSVGRTLSLIWHIDFYTWVRDAALTVQYLVEELVAGNASLQFLIQDYISSQARLQTVENPSGSLSSGGLGEPKFHVDETAFTDSWGRPQRDGPPLRAIAMISFANYLIVSQISHHASKLTWMCSV